jgi:manganese transport protein
VVLTGSRNVMGVFANGRLTQLAAIVATAVVLLLNTMLVLQAFGVDLPFLG